MQVFPRSAGFRALKVCPSPQEHLGVLNEDPVDIQFNQSGYLFLAGEQGAQIMKENVELQRWASVAPRHRVRLPVG